MILLTPLCPWKVLPIFYRATPEIKNPGFQKISPSLVAGIDYMTHLGCSLAGGEKTAALFVKSAIKIHRRLPDYFFWEDVPLEFEPHERIFLPVDRVIIELFKKIDGNKDNFKKINSLLIDECGYTPEQMLVWDDLWYWGFFTQKSIKPSKDIPGHDHAREFGWNEDKFWCQFSSQKK